MNRYQLITSRTPPGGYEEFSAADDAEAIEYARRYLWGARIVQLSELGPDFRTFRTVPVPQEGSR